jgi:hypothetical protein
MQEGGIVCETPLPYFNGLQSFQETETTSTFR